MSHHFNILLNIFNMLIFFKTSFKHTFGHNFNSDFGRDALRKGTNANHPLSAALTGWPTCFYSWLMQKICTHTGRWRLRGWVLFYVFGGVIVIPSFTLQMCLHAVPCFFTKCHRLEHNLLQETLSHTNHGWENMLSHSLTPTKRKAKKECFPTAWLPVPPVPVAPAPCERFYP